MNQTESLRPRLDQLQRRSLIIGVAGLVLCVVGAFISTEQFFRSYLFGYIFWIGLALGCFGVLMLHNLVGGAWGHVIRRVLESGTRTLPLMALLFVPLLFGLHSLYEWTHENVVAADKILQHKEMYLNEPFFIARTVFYFVAWIGLGWMITRALRKLEQPGGEPMTRSLQNFSAAALLLYFLTTTFAAFDWMMSLEPHWFSTVYGMLFITGNVLSTFAFSIAVIVLLMNSSPELKHRILPSYLHDLGNLLFAFTMFWAYISISQYLIIWSANLPEEVPWYIKRINGGWEIISIVLLVVHFALPFVLLLVRKNKRDATMLSRVAVLILIMRIIDVFWQIAPAFSHGHEPHFSFHWLDIVAPIGIGGIWLAMFLGQLKNAPTILAVNAPLKKEEHHG